MQHDTADIPRQLSRRAAAAHRLPPLDTGPADPWHYDPPPVSQSNLQAARRAWRHLHELDLIDTDDWQTGLLSGVAA